MEIKNGQVYLNGKLIGVIRDVHESCHDYDIYREFPRRKFEVKFDILEQEARHLSPYDIVDDVFGQPPCRPEQMAKQVMTKCELSPLLQDDEDGWLIEPPHVKAQRKEREAAEQAKALRNLGFPDMGPGIEYKVEAIDEDGVALPAKAEPIYKPSHTMAEALSGPDEPDYDTCMCGDSMKNHESAINCGHMPVSMGSYYGTREEVDEDGVTIPDQFAENIHAELSEKLVGKPLTIESLQNAKDIIVEKIERSDMMDAATYMMAGIEREIFGAFGMPSCTQIESNGVLTMEIIENAARLASEQGLCVPPDVVPFNRHPHCKSMLIGTPGPRQDDDTFRRMILGEFVEPKEAPYKRDPVLWEHFSMVSQERIDLPDLRDSDAGLVPMNFLSIPDPNGPPDARIPVVDEDGCPLADESDED